MEPILLHSNQPLARFYRGGERISQFRREKLSPPNTPEDWVGSTTSVRGTPPVGMTRLDDGRLLADAIAVDPLPWLGKDHVDRFGSDTMLLVKLLDAGQRLPVHAHPDGEFAAEYVAAAHGKAEAWYILSAGTVYLGLTQDVPLTELHEIVASQDSDRLLRLMHSISVDAGDCIFVPPGVLHAIGEGIFLAEVQEPEDLSILLEWTGFDLDGETHGHLGLGFDVALTAVEIRGRSEDEIGALVVRQVSEGGALPPDAASYFRLDRVAGRRDFPAGFAIVIALGDGRITTANGSWWPIVAGSTLLVPFSAGTFRLDGAHLVARPPQP